MNTIRGKVRRSSCKDWSQGVESDDDIRVVDNAGTSTLWVRQERNESRSLFTVSLTRRTSEISQEGRICIIRGGSSKSCHRHPKTYKPN